MLDHFLLLHIFQTTSVNVRWGQHLTHPASKLSKTSLRLDVFVCYVLVMKRMKFKKIQCFDSSWLLFMVPSIPINTWMWTKLGYQLPSIFSKGESVKLSKGQTLYSRICLIRHLKGIRKMWRITQTGENSIIEARIPYHSNSYAYIALLFAVKYKFMTLWLNTTINSSALSISKSDPESTRTRYIHWVSCFTS